MDKIHLLTRLASGEITLEEFRKECLASRQYGNPREKDGTKVSKTPAKKSQRKTEECIEDKTQAYLEKRLQEAEKKLLTETEKRKKLEIKIREKDKEIKTLTGYQEKVKEQERCINILTAKLNKQLESLRYMQQMALKRPRNDTDGDETQNLKQKKMESTCMDLECKSKVPSKKVNSKQNKSSDEHLKMQIKKEEGEGSEGTEQELALVEYNNKTFYLGIFSEENTFTFCKAPIGKVQNEDLIYNTSKMAMKLNRKDKQIINIAYLVCKFSGHVTKDTISMRYINKDKLETEIRNYLK